MSSVRIEDLRIISAFLFEVPTKDPIARKQRLRRRRGCDEETDDTEKVLKGMKDLAIRKDVNGSLPETPISLK